MASSDFREKGDKKCVPHPKEECGFMCVDCGIPICDRCTSTLHQRHLIKSLKIVAQDKYNFIQDFDNRIKFETIPKINDGVQTADDVVRDMYKLIDKGIQDTEEHRRYLKERIDRLADQTISQLTKLRKECLESFAKFKADSDRSIKKLEELVKSNRDVTKSDNNVLIVDTAKELARMKMDLQKFENLPEFKLMLGSRSDTDKLLKQAFGCITNMTKKSIQQHTTHDMRLQTTARQLLSNPTTTKTVKLSFTPLSMAVTRDGKVWLYELHSTSLYYMDQTNTLHGLKLKERLSDIAVNPHTDVLYCLRNYKMGILGKYKMNIINTVDRINGNITELFVPDGWNSCLAVNRDGNILVGDLNNPKVTLYTDKGTKLQMFTYTGTRPRQISVCMSTGMVALACQDSGVVVLDSGLNEIHRYMGPAGSDKLSDGLNTNDAVFDAHGHLVVVEYNRKHVNIIHAATGQHLQTITPDNMGFGSCLALNQVGDLIVGTLQPEELLISRYLK